MADEIRCAIELRADETLASPGRLFGTLLTYGERAGDRAEVFEANSLTFPDDGVLLRRQHVRAAPIMRVVPQVRDNALVVDQPLPDTAAGRDAAVEVRNGTLAGLSIEFNAKRQRFVDGVRRIQSAALVGAGLVDDPSYGGSRVELRGRRGRRRLWL